MRKIPAAELRQIHLDFHTPDYAQVGARFEAKALFDTLEASEVNAVCVFATCHHGNSYFTTRTGRRHPGLPFDLFGQAAAEAKDRPIDFIAYFSMNVNEVVAEAHPEWVALTADGRPVDTQILADGSELYWRWLCPNRGRFLEDFFFPHVDECLRAYPVDGVFIDMAGYLPGSCHCAGCLAGMRAEGLDPADETAHALFNSRTMERAARELRRRMEAITPGLRLEIGCYNAFGQVRQAVGVVSDLYVESLAFQGGWYNCPVMARYVAHAGLPVVGYTGRFLKNWGDFGTVVSLPQLKAQLGLQLTSGVACGIGDHLHADGALEPAVYAVIAAGLRFAKARQPWCTGIERLADLGLCVPVGVETNAALGPQGGPGLDLWETLYGAAKVCMEAHLQYDVIDPTMPLDGLRALVLMRPPTDLAWIERLEAYVAAGGSLVVDAAAIPVTKALEDRWYHLLGLTSATWSPHPGSFYRIADPALAQGVPAMANYVHAPSLVLEAAAGTQVLGQVRYPQFPRSRAAFYGHFHGGDTSDGGPALLSSVHGQGQVLVAAQALFTAYLQTGYHAHRTLLRQLLRRAIGTPLVTSDAPSVMDLVLGRREDRLVLQAMPFVSDRRHRTSFESINEVIPLGPHQVTVRTTAGARRVHNPITGQDLPFTVTATTVTLTMPAISEHTVVVITPDHLAG